MMLNPSPFNACLITMLTCVVVLSSQPSPQRQQQHLSFASALRLRSSSSDESSTHDDSSPELGVDFQISCAGAKKKEKKTLESKELRKRKKELRNALRIRRESKKKKKQINRKKGEKESSKLMSTAKRRVADTKTAKIKDNRLSTKNTEPSKRPLELYAIDYQRSTVHRCFASGDVLCDLIGCFKSRDICNCIGWQMKEALLTDRLHQSFHGEMPGIDKIGVFAGALKRSLQRLLDIQEKGATKNGSAYLLQDANVSEEFAKTRDAVLNEQAAFQATLHHRLSKKEDELSHHLTLFRHSSTRYSFENAVKHKERCVFRLDPYANDHARAMRERLHNPFITEKRAYPNSSYLADEQVILPNGTALIPHAVCTPDHYKPFHYPSEYLKNYRQNNEPLEEKMFHCIPHDFDRQLRKNALYGRSVDCLFTSLLPPFSVDGIAIGTMGDWNYARGTTGHDGRSLDEEFCARTPRNFCCTPYPDGTRKFIEPEYKAKYARSCIYGRNIRFGLRRSRVKDSACCEKKKEDTFSKDNQHSEDNETLEPIAVVGGHSLILSYMSLVKQNHFYRPEVKRRIDELVERYRKEYLEVKMSDDLEQYHKLNEIMSEELRQVRNYLFALVYEKKFAAWQVVSKRLKLYLDTDDYEKFMFVAKHGVDFRAQYAKKFFRKGLFSEADDFRTNVKLFSKQISFLSPLAWTLRARMQVVKEVMCEDLFGEEIDKKLVFENTKNSRSTSTHSRSRKINEILESLASDNLAIFQQERPAIDSEIFLHTDFDGRTSAFLATRRAALPCFEKAYKELCGGDAPVRKTIFDKTFPSHEFVRFVAGTDFTTNCQAQQHNERMAMDLCKGAIDEREALRIERNIQSLERIGISNDSSNIHEVPGLYSITPHWAPHRHERELFLTGPPLLDFMRGTVCANEMTWSGRIQKNLKVEEDADDFFEGSSVSVDECKSDREKSYVADSQKTVAQGDDTSAEEDALEDEFKESSTFKERSTLEDPTRSYDVFLTDKAGSSRVKCCNSLEPCRWAALRDRLFELFCQSVWEKSNRKLKVLGVIHDKSPSTPVAPSGINALVPYFP